MRLASDKIKEAILHPEAAVRSAAICYFSESLRRDPEIVPLAIQAMERYGRREAFLNISFLEELTQTDESVVWLIDEWRRAAAEAKSDPHQQVAVDRLSMLLADADAEVLKRHARDLESLDGLGEEVRAAIADRVALLDADPESCWREIEDFCDREKSSDYVEDAKLDRAYRRLEAIARHGERFRDRVMAVLEAEIDDVDDNPLTWMEGFAVWLAGEMGLVEAAPLLVEKLHADVEWLNEECALAFVKLAGRTDDEDASNRVIASFAEEYRHGAWHFRDVAATVLARVHTPAAEERLLQFLEIEDDFHLRVEIVQSLLFGCSFAGVDPARELISRYSVTTEILELRRRLLVSCKLLSAEFPEREAWTAEVQKEEEYRKRIATPAFQVVDTYSKFLEERAAKDAVERRERRAAARRATVPSRTGAAPRSEAAQLSGLLIKTGAGRNDPCPCGSGKKYKKCCLRG
jgi:HEAT repeat protein